MTKFIYFVLAAHFAHAAPDQGRPARVCGHIFKVETRYLRTLPLLYIVPKNGRTYVLYPDVDQVSGRRLLARIELMEVLMRLDQACLNGLVFGEVFVPESLARVGGDPRPRERAQPAQEQRAVAPARGNGKAQWVPWSRRAEDANP